MVMYGRSLLRTIYLAKLWLEERQDAEYAAVGVEVLAAPPDDYAVLSNAGRALLDHLESLSDEQIRAINIIREAGKLPGSTVDMTRTLPPRVSYRTVGRAVPSSDKATTIIRLMDDPALAEHLFAGRDRIQPQTLPNFL